MHQAVDNLPNASHVENTKFLDTPDLCPDAAAPISLLDFLSNHVVLCRTVPHLFAYDRLNLAATNRSFRHLILDSPGVFRHLDLTHVRAARCDVDSVDHGNETWRNAQLNDFLTEDDFYSGPLRGIFASLQRSNLLADVQTLILDGLSVTSELCHELILDPKYNIRVLSLRDTKNLNERKLCRTLQYACRPSRPKNTPRLKALYVFGSSQPALHPEDTQEEWYQKKGKIITRPIGAEWADALVDCHGIIAFDTLPCQGPRHINSPAYGKVPHLHAAPPPPPPSSSSSGARTPQWAVASYALPGCAGCGAAPEGLITATRTPRAELPLLSPPPLFASSLQAAATPNTPCSSSSGGGASSSFVARCSDCIRDRYCFSCSSWWCEDCYAPPTEPSHPTTALSLAPSDVVVVNPQGDAWVQQHEEESRAAAARAKPKARMLKSCWECGSNVSFCVSPRHRHLGIVGTAADGWIPVP
ncbi:hypothetical protein SODALDRAFT_268833 [Sodiomyces alkalinus F11]|uniref:F-box domain-containing protein n=1 Tax=Sodiomyces alkalinus (strain CBS 110278 / VKM F-3762 / F11) TaxID=1314773 RepID=A0A3N2Q800_SODAK|nr:hypothetical protein SODALDRAFT_268833 [Sodiomyces alkalinus F11]ROT42870.1 hypothetical protein SODALDRAFT_268833 [Sodiomyces alkalinus F11]